MQLTETVKLYLTKSQTELVKKTMIEYINTVNKLVQQALSGISIKRFSSKDVVAYLPSALKAQCIRDANSIVRKHYAACRKAVFKNRRLKAKGSSDIVTAPHLPILKKPCCFVNNQNFKFNGTHIEFPVFVNGKTTRISVSSSLTERQKTLFDSSKLGLLRIVVKNNKIFAQISYEVSELTAHNEDIVMGIDLGIKCPAVSYCSDSSVKFYSNGRKNKYIRRKYATQRKKLQKSKKTKALQHLNNKEQRIMQDIDHKLSRDIVNEAIAHSISLIKLERLSTVRSTTRKSRKNNYSLHNWSFYRLANYIEYKAKLAGIKVQYVNPAFTSQVCPVCGNIHHADDRDYTCSCGFHSHRDLVGAINICNSTEYVGDSITVRHTA